MATYDEKTETNRRFADWYIDCNIAPPNTKYINNTKQWKQEAFYVKINWLLAISTSTYDDAALALKNAVRVNQIPVPISIAADMEEYNTTYWIALGTVIMDEIYDAYMKFWNATQTNNLGLDYTEPQNLNHLRMEIRQELINELFHVLSIGHESLNQLEPTLQPQHSYNLQTQNPKVAHGLDSNQTSSNAKQQQNEVLQNHNQGKQSFTNTLNNNNNNNINIPYDGQGWVPTTTLQNVVNGQGWVENATSQNASDGQGWVPTAISQNVVNGQEWVQNATSQNASDGQG